LDSDPYGFIPLTGLAELKRVLSTLAPSLDRLEGQIPLKKQKVKNADEENKEDSRLKSIK